jgi:hypothetical protein
MRYLSKEKKFVQQIESRCREENELDLAYVRVSGPADPTPDPVTAARAS